MNNRAGQYQSAPPRRQRPITSNYMALPPAPAVEIPTRLGTLGIGNAARGLCGGMVFAAWPVRGFFRAAYSPADPPDL